MSHEIEIQVMRIEESIQRIVYSLTPPKKKGKETRLTRRCYFLDVLEESHPYYYYYSLPIKASSLATLTHLFPNY